MDGSLLHKHYRSANSTDPQSRLLQRNLKKSSFDGASFGAMVGLGETFVPAFALALGMGETASGLIAALPVAAGGIMQTLSLRLMPLFKTEQRWVVSCAALQATSFVPLLVAALMGYIAFPLLLLIMICYWTGGLASGPAWNTWMERVVPRSLRAVYFARRTRFQQQSTLVGLVAGGMFLQVAAANDLLLLGFALLFGLAGIFRYASVAYIAAIQPDDRWTEVGARRPAQVATSTAESGKRLIVYLVFMQASVHISGPFFAPYMLKQLQMNYLVFVYLLAVAFVARIITLSFWGSIAKQFGASTLLWAGAIGLVPLASLWIVSGNFVWLTAVQALSGVAWAAYELGFFLLFFETLPAQSRIRMLTYYNFANTMAMLFGSLLGAGIFLASGGGVFGYFVLFAVSSVGRLSALLLLWQVRLETVPITYVAVRVLGLRPATATLDAPVLPSLESDAP